MKKSKAGRKPADGIKAKTPCERQRKCRKQKELETENAINNIAGSSTEILLKVFQRESKRINQGEVDDRTVMRKIIVTLCDRHELPIENVEEDVGGLLDVDDDVIEEIRERRNSFERLKRVDYLISMRQSELDSMKSEIESERTELDTEPLNELREACACEVLILELLYRERQAIALELRGV